MKLSTDTFGIQIIPKGSFLDQVQMGENEVSLHAAGHGTEVIHHRISVGKSWSLVPPTDDKQLEYIYILSGKMKMKSNHHEVTLQAGDAVSAQPVQEHYHFIAQEDTEFIYVTSHPVYHNYSENIRKMMELAVEIEQKDGNTSDHCARISKMSLKVGEEMNLSPQQLVQLSHAAFFHDIGKIRIPDHILNKPGKLTPEEWEIMKQHTTLGREILEESGDPYLIASSEIVEQHHERYDGKGYPKGLTGDRINILAAIISVVDSFDAMTYDRVYRNAIPREAAIEEIVRWKGMMYHPDVVDVFLRIVDQL